VALKKQFYEKTRDQKFYETVCMFNLWIFYFMYKYVPVYVILCKIKDSTVSTTHPSPAENMPSETLCHPLRIFCQIHSVTPGEYTVRDTSSPSENILSDTLCHPWRISHRHPLRIFCQIHSVTSGEYSVRDTLSPSENISSVISLCNP